MSEKITRRDFLKKGTMALVSTDAITACGDLIAHETGEKIETKEIAVGQDRYITMLDELKDLKAINFTYNGKKSILLFNEGEIKAFENLCTHKGGPTKLIDNKLVCQWHGASFDPLTGAATKAPAPTNSKLPEVKVLIRDGKISLAS